MRVRCVWLLAAIMAGFASTIAAAAPAQRAPINYRLLVHPEGQPPLTLYAEEIGQGPPILLLHGLGGSSYTWRAVAPALAASHRVIAVDLRGFGRSEKPFDLAYAPSDHAAAVAAFIRARRLSSLTVVGHSFGGLVGLLLAMDRRLEPQRIARLVVVDAPAYPQPFSPAVDFLRTPLLPYVLLNVLPPELPTALSLAMEKMGLDNLRSRDVDVYADPLHEPGGSHALIQTARQIEPPNIARVVAGYRTIAKPTLVLACREDQVVPLSSAVRLSHAIPGARLGVLEHCDHIPPEQAPAAVVAAIRRFIGG